jgi:hypothetical protein
MSETALNGAKDDPDVRGVRGVIPLRQENQAQIVTWKVERGARHNYRRLGKHLARRNPSLFRNTAEGHGLIQVAANGACRLLTKASQLAPVIVDTLTMKVMKEGKVVSELPTAAHLCAMLHAEAFLRQFRPVDQVARTPSTWPTSPSFTPNTTTAARDNGCFTSDPSHASPKRPKRRVASWT